MLYLETSHYPVLLTKSLRTVDADIIRAIDMNVEFAKRAANEKKYYAAIAFEGDVIDARQRRLFAERVKNADSVLKQRMALSVVIITNPIKRGALTALLWLVGPEPRTIVVGSVGAALDAVQRALAEKQVSMPSSLTAEVAIRFDLSVGLDQNASSG